MPEEPNDDSSLDDTRAYLDELRAKGNPIEVRRLLSFWGFKTRGKNVVQVVSADLERMGLKTEPPFDSGRLDGWVTVQEDRDDDGSGRPADHLLALSRIPSASFALDASPDAKVPPGYVAKSTTVSDAVTTMLRYDFSQLPVVDDRDSGKVVGVFNWESYGQARLRGDDPRTVADALVRTVPVDLHSDLFLSIAPIANQGYVLVTYEGVFAGIVTSADLAVAFEDLALPFLAVGRCEQELKRVAAVLFPAAVEKHKKKIDDLMFGEVQAIYRNNWGQLKWQLSEIRFNEWLDSTRNLRNAIAHFDQDLELGNQLRAVHQLTTWLMGITADGVEAASEEELHSKVE